MAAWLRPVRNSQGIVFVGEVHRSEMSVRHLPSDEVRHTWGREGNLAVSRGVDWDLAGSKGLPAGSMACLQIFVHAYWNFLNTWILFLPRRSQLASPHAETLGTPEPCSMGAGEATQQVPSGNRPLMRMTASLTLKSMGMTGDKGIASISETSASR